MSRTADVLVIGAGMAGVGAAARLAPERRVVVLEMEERPAHHTTGRSAASFILNYGNAVLRALNRASEEVLRTGGDLDEGGTGRGFLGPRGLLYVAAEGHEAHLDHAMDGASGMEEIAADEAVRHFPLLRRDRVARAAVERDASDIDVDALLQAFLRTLRRHGGEVVPHAEVSTMLRRGGTWRVETPAGSFEAPVVVDAAGAWGDVVAARARIAPIGLQPMRRSIAVVPVPEGHDPRRWPLVASAAEDWYAKPDGGRLWVSPADEDPVEPHDAWPDDLVLAEGIDRFQRMVAMEVRRVERSWAGLRTFAPDRTPIVGPEPEAEGFFWLCGQGGYGIQTAPALSRLAADLVLGLPPALPDATVGALSPARFRT
jgi:D-arginine dehydrogenase